MGLAASQARLLLLTAKNDALELVAQQIENERLILAQEQELIAQEYTDATSDSYKYVRVTNPDGTTTQESLTLDSLAKSMSGQNQSIIIADANGNPLIAARAEIVDGEYKVHYSVIVDDEYVGDNEYRKDLVNKENYAEIGKEAYTKAKNLRSNIESAMAQNVENYNEANPGQTVTVPKNHSEWEQHLAMADTDTLKEAMGYPGAEEVGTEEVGTEEVGTEETGTNNDTENTKKKLSGDELYTEWDKLNDAIDAYDNSDKTSSSIEDLAKAINEVAKTTGQVKSDATYYTMPKVLESAQNTMGYIDPTEITDEQEKNLGEEGVKLMQNAQDLIDVLNTKGAGTIFQNGVENGGFQIWVQDTSENANIKSADMMIGNQFFTRKTFDALTNGTSRYYTENDAAAQAKYDTAMAKVSALDSKLENRLNQVETQKKAVEQEMESVDSIIKSNIERTFKYFG